MNTSVAMRSLALSAVATMAISSVALLASPATAAPATIKLVASSADGAAFDLDEYVDGDVSVQVTDSVAGPIDITDQSLLYHWSVQPFDKTPAVRVPATGEDVQAVELNGSFAVPLPAAHTPGTYVLVAGLGPDASAAHAVTAATLTTVKAGNAALTFTDAAPLRTAAGADRTVSGKLRLEDGTGLTGRLVDLDLTRGTAGTDPEPDAGPSAPQVTTGTGGAFSVVLSDPAEDGQGTELGGRLDAGTAFTPDASLAVDFVSKKAPAGSSLALDDLGGGKPGEALAGELTVTAPDDTYDTDPTVPGVQGDADGDADPVEGQLYTLRVDHGFFTSGADGTPPVIDGLVGNLENLGTTLAGVTDADGKVSFQVGIARDQGFDADGLVAAVVTATAGDLSGTTTAAWDSAHPFNGGRVKVALSPKSEQPAPVNPTVAGNRTYYDVFTLDQFGNRVTGEPVDITYSGDLDDWDYSADFVTSDLDSSGDLWVASFEPGVITTTGTWNAPTLRYVDPSGGTLAGSTDVTDSATNTFYEPDFRAARFGITSSANGQMAEVGTAATTTVSVVDQKGNPVQGYRVQFFRFGPGTTGGEPKISRFTNAAGQATYTFIGTRVGLTRVTAEVSDGVGTRVLSKYVVFGSPVRARLAAVGNGPAADQVTVRATPLAAGAQVVLYRVLKGKRVVVGSRPLDASGKVSFKAKDRNRKRATRYVAVVRSTSTTMSAVSNTAKVR